MNRSILHSFVSAALAVTALATPALARDQGIINQSSTYERSMAVYMHPAGYFFEAQPVVASVARNTDHPAVLVNRQAWANELPAAAFRHPALGISVSRSLLTRARE